MNSFLWVLWTERYDKSMETISRYHKKYNILIFFKKKT